MAKLIDGAFALAMAVLLAGCGYTPEQRATSGAAIGGATGRQSAHRRAADPARPWPAVFWALRPAPSSAPSTAPPPPPPPPPGYAHGYYPPPPTCAQMGYDAYGNPVCVAWAGY